MKFKLTNHVIKDQAPAIGMDGDFILHCAANPSRINFKENHPDQFEIQRDLECGFTVALAIAIDTVTNALVVMTVYPKGLSRPQALELWNNHANTVNVNVNEMLVGV